MSTRSDVGALPPAGVVPLCVPEMAGNEWDYIKSCLDSGWVSSVGQYVDQFETMLAEFVGAQYAVATVNGTAALHIALLVAGVQPDDEVIVSNVTFISPVNAIRYIGAHPVLIDAEPDYWQMDIERVRAFLEGECAMRDGIPYNQRTGRRVRAVLPVHILGHPVDMDALLALAHHYGLAVIEDATESLGTHYKGRMVGTLGDVGCFSFNGNKLITTGGGGMMVTNNSLYAQKARYLTTQAKDDPLEYVHGEVGFNYRLTNVLAAMGCAQMEQIEAYIAKKRAIAQRYQEAFSRVAGIIAMPCAEWAESTFWLYTIRVDATLYGMTSRELLRHLHAQQIQTRPLWQPMHLSPAQKGATFIGDNVSKRLWEECLSLPCSVGLTDEQQAHVIQAIQLQRT